MGGDGGTERVSRWLYSLGGRRGQRCHQSPLPQEAQLRGELWPSLHFPGLAPWEPRRPASSLWNLFFLPEPRIRGLMQNDNVGALCSNPFRISGWCQRRQTLRETLRSTGCAKVQFAGLGNWLARPTPPGALREMDFFCTKQMLPLMRVVLGLSPSLWPVCLQRMSPGQGWPGRSLGHSARWWDWLCAGTAPQRLLGCGSWCVTWPFFSEPQFP